MAASQQTEDEMTQRIVRACPSCDGELPDDAPAGTLCLTCATARVRELEAAINTALDEMIGGHNCLCEAEDKANKILYKALGDEGGGESRSQKPPNRDDTKACVDPGKYTPSPACKGKSMETKKERPAFVTDEMLVYLDELRESGVTNMFGAGPYIEDEFGLGRTDARKVLTYWMETFSERHPK